MMRIYRRWHPSRIFNLRAFVVAIALVLIFGAFHFIFPSVLPNALYQIATPIVRGWEGAVSLCADFFAGFYSKNRLASENEELLKQLSEAREKLLALELLRSDFEALQSAHSRSEENKEVLAAVLIAPPSSPYDTLVIDAGVRENIAVGALVRSIGGSALGKVTEVFRDFSRVSLFSSPGNETPVRIGAEGVQGKAVGIGNGGFQIVLPKEFSVSVGDAVILPSLSLSPLGIVQYIDFQEADFLQLVSFQSAVNMRGLSHVMVEFPLDSPEQDEE